MPHKKSCVYLLSQIKKEIVWKIVSKTKVLINDFGIDFNTRQSVFKIVMLVISIIIMLLLNNGSLKDFGFTKPKTINYFRLVWLTIVVNVLSVLISSIIFLGVLNYFFPQDGLNYMVSEKNILTTIVTIWLLSSLSETVLTRGLFQSFLRNLKYIKFFKLSLPVILTGLYFGLLHITVFFAGKSIWFTFQLFFITSCTGIVAAYYREKSDSIFPAFLSSSCISKCSGECPFAFGNVNIDMFLIRYLIAICMV